MWFRRAGPALAGKRRRTRTSVTSVLFVYRDPPRAHRRINTRARAPHLKPNPTLAKDSCTTLPAPATSNMYTNPFERKHSALRQVLDRFIGPDARLSFRKKKDVLKNSRVNVSGSSSSVNSSSLELNLKVKYEKR